MDDEWERYVESQKYARSLGWNAESGHVKALLIVGACAIVCLASLIYVAAALGRAVACWAWFYAC